ncbi:MAG: preprotein translocase subunit YajC [Alphaproteobacteria bacterium]|nr:preprotein translocase subunit YajC [Alphaproteobacteria bacterium]
MMFISDAWAQATAPMSTGASTIGIVIQLVCIMLVFYFLLIRPQQKKIKEHEALLNAMKKGDNVITGGGIYAKITAIDGDKISVEVAKGVEIVVHKYTIREVLNDNNPEIKKIKTTKNSKTKK